MTAQKKLPDPTSTRTRESRERRKPPVLPSGALPSYDVLLISDYPDFTAGWFPDATPQVTPKPVHCSIDHDLALLARDDRRRRLRRTLAIIAVPLAIAGWFYPTMSQAPSQPQADVQSPDDSVGAHDEAVVK